MNLKLSINSPQSGDGNGLAYTTKTATKLGLSINSPQSGDGNHQAPQEYSHKKYQQLLSINSPQSGDGNERDGYDEHP